MDETKKSFLELKQKQQEQREKVAIGVLSTFAGIALFVFLLETVYNDIAFNLTIGNGIGPYLGTVLFSIILLALSIGSLICFSVIKRKTQKNNYLFLILGMILLSFGVCNIINMIVDKPIKEYRLSETDRHKYFEWEIENNGYLYIGDVVGYDKNLKKTNQSFLLCMKEVGGQKNYYCYRELYYRKLDVPYLVKILNDEYGMIEVGDNSYIILYNFDRDNSEGRNDETESGGKAQNTNKLASTNESLEGESNEPQKIIVEHKRELQPVQKWQNCGACGGSTLCATCGGSGQNPYNWNAIEECPQCHGTRICTMCGGRGGWNYTVLE